MMPSDNLSRCYALVAAFKSKASFLSQRCIVIVSEVDGNCPDTSFEVIWEREIYRPINYSKSTEKLFMKGWLQ